jgi:hypothetical protein
VLSAIAILDEGLLLALAYGIVSAEGELVLVLAPTYSVLFLVLVGSLAAFADRRAVSWVLVTGIVLVGPLGAAVALRFCHHEPRG